MYILLCVQAHPVYLEFWNYYLFFLSLWGIDYADPAHCEIFQSD